MIDVDTRENPARHSSPRRTLAERALVSAHTDIQVPFQDVDAVEIVWHGNYFRYFEQARAELLRRIGYDYPAMRESGYAWPLVDASARFMRPARYAQWLRVAAGLVEWEARMRVEYLVTDRDSGIRLGRGMTVQCAVTMDTWEMQFASPPALLERLQPWL